MTAEAIIDIPVIPRINELESVNTRRHSTGKVIMQNGGVTVLSRYLRTSQGSCHDICKYGTSCTLETESKSPRSPMPKIAALKLAGTGRIPERSESNLGVKPSANDLVDIKTIAEEGETHDEERDETKLSREKKPEVSLKHSPGSNSQKPFDPDCIVSEISSGTDKEFVSPKEVLLPLKETDVAVAHARDSKMRPQSKPSSASSSRQNFEGSKSKETNLMSMTSVSSGKNKGEMTIIKGIRTSVMGDKKDVVAPSVSLFPEESSTSVSSMNAKKTKSSGVCRSKKQENAMQIKPERSSGKNAKGSKSQKGVSHLMDQENVKKPDSEEGSFADIPEKTLDIIKPNPENKPAESIQNSVHASDFSTMPSSSSKDKSLKHTQSRVPTGQSPRSYEKKNMIYRPKGIHAHRLPLSLSSYPGKKDLRSSPYVTQPSLTSSSSLTSSKSPHGDALSQHDEVAAQKPNISSKLMYKGRPKVALITTSKDKQLQGEKLNFQRGKVIEVPLEDYTPRRLAVKLRRPIDNRNGDNTKEKVEDCTPKRLKFRRRVLVDNRSGANQNGGEEFTPRRLKFRRRVLVDYKNDENHNDREEDCTPKRLKFRRRVLDNRTGDNQNRGDEFTPRRLKFRQRVLVDSRNDENHHDRGEECTPKRLKFRRRVLVDNRAGGNQNGGEEFTPRRLKFRRRVLVDNRNDDNHNDRAEGCTPWKLKLRQRVLDINKTGYIHSSVGDASKNNSKGKEANVGQDNAKEVQSEKISLRRNDVEKKKDSGSLYNNMIEETASRLVRTKSSKVKALVSAFETVISHLDTPISATNNIH